MPFARRLADGREPDVSADRARAVRLAREVCGMLSDLGVEAKVFGSLAQGRFTPHSDIDFLVVSCPRNLKYAIEGRIEDRLGGTPFDVAYLDELPPGKRARFLEEAIDAGDLR